MSKRMVCCECRKPDDNLMLLVPFVGYSDSRRPCCSDCYLVGRTPRHSGYLQQRFAQREMPYPIPLDIAKHWGGEP